MFVNIIIIVLQLAYETETLNKNNVKKIHLSKNTKTFKNNQKKPKDIVLTVSEKHKNIGTKTHQIFLVCATQPTHFSRRDYSIKSFKK